MKDNIKIRLAYLLDRCIAEKETPQEREELDVLLLQYGEDADLQACIVHAFQQEKDMVDMSPTQQVQILQSIPYTEPHPVIESGTRRRINYIKWASIAAIFLLVAIPAMLRKDFYGLRHMLPKENIAAIDSNDDRTSGLETKRDHRPAQEKAFLTMGDGTVIELENLQMGEPLLAKGLRLEKLSDGALSLQFEANEAKHSNLDHTIVTPRGATYEIVLADGTRVFMNSASKLTFPRLFNGSERRVSFEGEGYFEVTKDKTKPFIVVSKSGGQQQEVQVYGTTFNISAYPAERQMTTTLVEGSVKVKDLLTNEAQFIEPAQQAVTSADGLTVELADMDANLAWKNNLFYFANTPINEVMNQVSRKYDVDFKYTDDITHIKVWGQISRTKRLPEILSLLEKSSGLQFVLIGKEVRVVK